MLLRRCAAWSALFLSCAFDYDKSPPCGEKKKNYTETRVSNLTSICSDNKHKLPRLSHETTKEHENQNRNQSKLYRQFSMFRALTMFELKSDNPISSPVSFMLVSATKLTADALESQDFKRFLGAVWWGSHFSQRGAFLFGCVFGYDKSPSRGKKRTNIRKLKPSACPCCMCCLFRLSFSLCFLIF